MVESTRSDDRTGLERAVELEQYRLSVRLIATVSDLQGEQTQSDLVEETLLSAGTARYAVTTLEQDRDLSVRYCWTHARKRLYPLEIRETSESKAA